MSLPPLPPSPPHAPHHPPSHPQAHPITNRDRQRRPHPPLFSTPGASSFYRGGLTLYTLASRVLFGGWTEEMLKTYKGPTEGVVLGLARHHKRVLGADWVLAESGTAGPSRSVPGKNGDPGYVALAVVGPGVEKTLERNLEDRGRGENMIQFAGLGMGLLVEAIEEELKRQGRL